MYFAFSFCFILVKYFISKSRNNTLLNRINFAYCKLYNVNKVEQTLTYLIEKWEICDKILLGDDDMKNSENSLGFDVSNYFKKIRNEKQLSIEDLSAKTGFDVSFISDYEENGRDFYMSEAKTISNALGVSFVDMLKSVGH